MDSRQMMQNAYRAILSNDFEQAIDWFEKAIELEPQQPEFHYRLSITYARSDRLKQAWQHADRACQLKPDHEEYVQHAKHVNSRLLLKEAEKCFTEPVQPELAVSLIRQAVSFDPLTTEGFIMLGMAYAEMEDYHAAIQAMNEALKLNPEHNDADRLKKYYKTKLTTYLNDEQNGKD